MSQGSVPAAASQNHNPVEANQITGGAHDYASYYSSIPAYDAASWGTQRTDNIITGTETTPNTKYNYAQPTETQPAAVQGTVIVASQDSLASGTSVPQEYSSYPPYQSSNDPYSYSNTANQSYYNNYQQLSTQASSQPSGAYQNLGAPHQPISSFQNTGSYAEPANYSSSYYNPGGYQTSSGGYPSQTTAGGYTSQTTPGGYQNQATAGGYQNQATAGGYQNQAPAGGYQNQTTAGGYQNQTTAGGYQNQTTAGGYQNQTTAGGYQNQNATGGYPLSSYHNPAKMWNGGVHANYSSQQQTYYAPDTSSAYSSNSTDSTAAQYQQQYPQWAEYYNQTEVSCAPGTEHISKTAAPNPGYAVPGVSSAYSTTVSQQPQPVIPPSRHEPSPTVFTGSQTSDVGSGVQDTYWQHTVPGFQNQHVRPHVDYQNRTDTNPSYNSFQDSQKTLSAHGTNSQYIFVQKVPPNYQPPLQTVPSADPHAVSNIQIPTNPKIASNFPFTSPKNNKSHLTNTNAISARPAYISVSAPKSNEKVAHPTSESSLKPGVFPKSLRGYVERALSRCKDDEQKAASQAVMTEMITKATADGTLHTRDWDTEPLFAMPKSSTVNFKFQNSSIVPSPTQKRDLTRRSKSRWEPVQEDKPADKPAPVDNGMFKYGGWVPASNSNNKFGIVNLKNKEEKSNNVKFEYEQKSPRKNSQVKFKRQRLNESVVTSAGDASSDSDKEQSLTAYYSGAITLADTPEEKQRRESRSKRFEGLKRVPEANHLRQRPTAEKQLYTRRAREITLSKTVDESTTTAVEDIDWDALTVKGTSQEIEKRYLRLTCAPDPASVRPEEILEIALTMVQNSKKNYLYKCDQLKSIRQDLTVQRIRNRLTVQVYETHARLALEVGDLPEYNQCQSQLQSLYADGIEGSYMEFSAYNLLCVMLHSKNTRDLVSAMSRLPTEAKKNEAVKHALAVRTAVTSGNYVLFFKLLKSAPKLHACLMDIYVEKMRFWAIKCMSRSYRPTVPVSYIFQVLGFGSSVISMLEEDTNESGGIEECIEWLKAHGAVLTAANNGDIQLDTKDSSSSLFMPEPEDAVPHGDANLAVNDFFTRSS